MGIKDVTRRQQRDLRDLEARSRRPVLGDPVRRRRSRQRAELQQLRSAISKAYRPSLKLPHDEQPHVYNGGHVVPTELWVPALPATPPPGAHVVFDFERVSWAAASWTQSGAAWGAGPVTEVPNLAVFGATGRRFASSAVTRRCRDRPPDVERLPARRRAHDHVARRRHRRDQAACRAVGQRRDHAHGERPAPGGESMHRVTLDLHDLAARPRSSCWSTMRWAGICTWTTCGCGISDRP